MTRRILPFLLAAVVLAPQAAHAAVSIEAFYGLSRPKSGSFSQSITGTANDPHLIRDSLNVAGGDLLFHLGTFEIGAIVDQSWKSNSASQTAAGALIGVGGDLDGWLRLEALGEVGAQRYGNFTENVNVSSTGSSSKWFTYLGLRPGVAVRVPVGTGKTGVLVGVWGFARWDLTSSNVPVTVGSAGSTSPGSVKLGGTTLGAELRLGLDF